MRKILIVDDDPNIAFLLQVSLSNIEGYGTEIASSGQEGLDSIAREKPAIVLLDVMMPGMDGFEVCRRIKEQEETQMIPVIMITAKSEMSDKLHGIDIGAIDYIAKPFNPDELEARVKAHLCIQELEQKLSDKKETEAVMQMAITLQHEINNPLTGVVGNLELLRAWQDLPPDEVNQAIGDAYDLSIRIKNLVAKMNKLTRVVATTYVGDAKMIDIHKSAEEE